MLTFLRRKKIAKKILLGLAIIIIPAFIFWGVGNVGKKTIAGSAYVGTIQGRKIPIDDFFSAKGGTQVQLILNYLGQKEVLDKLLKDRVLINRLTWDRLVMLDAAKKDGIRVKDKEVVAYITSHPLFVNKGVFDDKFYKYMVEKNLGMNTRIFEEHIREALEIAKLKDGILDNIDVTDDEAREAYRKHIEKGKLTYVSMDAKDYEKDAVITDEEISSYYRDNKKLFTVPPKIGLEYIEFPYNNFSEKDYLLGMVKNIYRKVSDNPEYLARAAEDNAREVKETGLFFRKDAPPAFNFNSTDYDTLFRMKTGAVGIFSSEGVQGAVFIVKVTENVPSQVKPEKEVAASIKEAIISRKAEEITDKKAEEIYDVITKKGLSLEDAANKFGLKKYTTDFITRFDYLEGVGDAVTILDKVFTEKPKIASKPFKTRRGYVIVRLDAFEEIDEDAFLKEKDDYKEKVLVIKRTKVLEDWYSNISSDSTLTIDLRYL